MSSRSIEKWLENAQKFVEAEHLRGIEHRRRRCSSTYGWNIIVHRCNSRRKKDLTSERDHCRLPSSWIERHISCFSAKKAEIISRFNIRQRWGLTIWIFSILIGAMSWCANETHQIFSQDVLNIRDLTSLSEGPDRNTVPAFTIGVPAGSFTH